MGKTLHDLVLLLELAKEVEGLVTVLVLEVVL